MNSLVLYVFAGILVFAGLVLALIFRFHHGGVQLNVDKYRRRWIEIERKLSRSNADSCHLAVIEADKLLDTALKESGAKGDTMGERLKNTKHIWSSNDSVWSAHKLRNRLVHEPDAIASYETARKALAGFKRALKDIGAI